MFVRTASERDLETIKALLAETWHATYDAIYGVERVDEITAEWHSLASLKARLTRPNSEFLVADDGKKIAGMAFAAATSDGKVLVLHQLYIRPGNQRAGVGRLLLDEVEQSFPEARTMRVEVEEANAPALVFYAASGFVRAGETANCGAEQSGIPALILEKKLG
ncbi:GNAT family N-acetyltransferase [Aminobacter carboxidus]|uniref:GNAT family N-acetyltransferase n=1 Tax=Aminobacter carboxidus TaxID=376165 RepID=A0A8E1WET8_9HYPH|nr:GNAT family N-acetyltransferase [Aminobacter lissarensis]MBB6466634.1 ribosomal protein S18 acetylase RimI-like enzyme [Aminobacter lissarensis]MBE1203740.1 GNAT family N-acetyltransferase [Aminobacter carboxidus]